MRPHFNWVFVLNFVISGKVTSLPKVIKYVKRSKYSFHDFSAKHIAERFFKLFAFEIMIKRVKFMVLFMLSNIRIIKVNKLLV